MEPHPHRPVVLSFSIEAEDQTYLAFQKPPDIPVVLGKEVGPQEEKWSRVLAIISQLLACKAVDVDDEMLSKAYDSWTDVAEGEFAGLAGVNIKAGFRSQAPVLVARRVDQQRSRCNKWQGGLGRALTCILGRAKEFQKAWASRKGHAADEGMSSPVHWPPFFLEHLRVCLGLCWAQAKILC